MRQKAFRARKKHQKRRKRAKQKVRLHEQGQLKYEQLPRLAREMLAKKRRAERTAA
ncbi:MAG: hypothetical protein HYY26_05010 [Acidobacteria bacterium]|nr:hypothetical protein [Acidobacteriota bacterium]